MTIPYFSSVVPLLLASLGLSLCSRPATAQTQTPFGCTNNSYLFQGGTTVGYLLDFATGATVAQGTANGNNGNIYVPSGGTAAILNAVGYNPVDGYIWSQYNGTNQLVRIGTEFVGKAYAFTQPTGYSQTTFTVGDVDVNGVLYMTRGGSAEGVNNPNTDVYTIDLKQTASPLVAKVVSFKSRTFLTDWALSPKDSCLYAINTYFTGNNYQYNENNTKIYRFVTHNRRFNGVVSLAGTRETLGVAAGGSTPITPANFAAAFMDGNGSFYVVASGSGLVHRLDRPDLLPAVADASATATSIAATYVGTVTSGLGNNVDGARCAYSRPSSGALPVQLTAFDATAAPYRRVQLRWHTASENQNAYFEVQHSTDGRSFTALGRVAGQGTVATSSAYTYTDPTPGPDVTHYYRLRQVDQDGSSTYSPVRALALAAGSSAVQWAVAPNPTTSGRLRVLLEYAGPRGADATLMVRGLLGQVVLTQPVTLQPGANVLVPAATLPPGTYWLSLGGEVAADTPGLRLVIAD